MRLSEITSNARKAKRRIDNLYYAYTVSKSGDAYLQLLAEIAELYPTGYPELDATLMQYKAELHSDVKQALKGLNF